MPRRAGAHWLRAAQGYRAGRGSILLFSPLPFLYLPVSREGEAGRRSGLRAAAAPARREGTSGRWRRCEEEAGDASGHRQRLGGAGAARHCLRRPSLPPFVPPAGLSLQPRRRTARARRRQPLPPPTVSDRSAAPQDDARPLAAEEGVTARSGPAAAGRRSGAPHLRSRGWAGGRIGGARRPGARGRRAAAARRWRPLAGSSMPAPVPRLALPSRENASVPATRLAAVLGGAAAWSSVRTACPIPLRL